jgi:hypothetical protein
MNDWHVGTPYDEWLVAAIPLEYDPVDYHSNSCIELHPTVATVGPEYLIYEGCFEKVVCMVIDYLDNLLDHRVDVTRVVRGLPSSELVDYYLFSRFCDRTEKARYRGGNKNE